MSFETELRLPGSKPYEYVNLTVRGDSYIEFVGELDAVEVTLLEKLKDIHRMAADIMLARTMASAPVANPQRTTVVSATELIQSELGGTVISETANPDQKPWERAKPATQSVNLF